MKMIRKIFSEWDDIKGSFRWLFEQSRGVRRYILVFLLISFVSMAFSLASPVASKFVVDAATNGNRAFRVEYVLIMLGTTVCSIGLNTVSNIFSSYVNEKYAFTVRARMFDRTQRSSWRNVSEFHSGDMLARLTTDVDVISANIISVVPSVLITVLQLIIIVAILLATDPVLVLIGLTISPIGVLLSLLTRRPFQRYNEELRDSQSEYYSFFQESLANISVIKAFQMEDYNNQRFDALRQRRMKTVMKSARLNALLSAVIRIIYASGYVVAFGWCSSQLRTNPAYTFGTMTMFLTMVNQIQSSVRSLGGVVPRFYTTVVCANRVRKIANQPMERYDGTKKQPKAVGLELDGVCFAYDNEKILKNLSLRVEPLERVGIVGASGAGKTTLIRLLLALVEPDAGKLYFTDENGEKEEISPDCRRFISYVPQGNTLLTGTVRENLQVGKPNATEDEMWQALEEADAARFVRKDPRGLDMPIKEHSGGVSAGQAQRICIARALMRDCPVMVLDEATSALDEATERRIFQVLAAKKDKTCFIITHRSSMLQYCTSVISVDGMGNAFFDKLGE